MNALDGPRRTRTTVGPVFPTSGFCHEALFYSGALELVAALEDFVIEGLITGNKVFVVLSAPKLESLRAALGNAADEVTFADMDIVGANPARIIPLWSGFVNELLPGQGARGVGEPVTASREPPELAECQVHESLLNLAFAGTSDFWLLCPYDTAELDEGVLSEARHSHAYVGSRGKGPTANEHYAEFGSLSWLSGRHLPKPPAPAEHMFADLASIGAARQAVRARASSFGLGEPSVEDFALAVHEVMANSLAYGGGRGEISIWAESDRLICEVYDHGQFNEPLAGRRRPTVNDERGRGLWIANQLCDLVQIRSVPDGSVVRLHMRKRP